MQRLLNSLTARLIFVTLVGTTLVTSLGIVSWQSITRLSEIGDTISEAENQEVRILEIESLAHLVNENPATRDANLRQLEGLMLAYDQSQENLRQQAADLATNPVGQQVVITLDDVDAQWATSRALLATYLAASVEEQTAQEDALLQSMSSTYVYADRVSEGLQAITVRQRQATLRSYAIVGVVTAATIVFLVSMLLNISRSMRELADVAKAYSGGIYSLRADSRTFNEIAVLGQAFNDMSDAVRQREAALIELGETLEQRVRERTSELEKATAEAREASRAKDEFLSVMSHELRTPLNAILGYQGILELTGNLEESNLDMVQRTEANARRLMGLINDVLDISRIEAGRMQILPSAITIRNFVADIERQVEVLATGKDIEFDVTIADTVPAEISMDEDALNKIITNLLGNAFKFTDAGKVGLDIATNNGNLQIAVSDTGIGIPAHMHHVIFERFRQADSSSTRNYGGSGLGLSIVQQLCILMDGTVNVESTVGEGSTFTVSLPVLEPSKSERLRI